jgi:hypothetical protein
MCGLSSQPNHNLTFFLPQGQAFFTVIIINSKIFTLITYRSYRLFWIWWAKCILRYSPAGEGVEGTTPDTEDTEIDRSYVS